MNKHLLYLISLIFLLIAFSSCKSQRSKNRKPIKLLGPEYVLSQMRENQSTYNWFSGKAKVDFIEGRRKTPFTAQLRIKRDSVIWISLSSGIGVEGARLLLTQDSVKYLNRLNKTYFVGDYEFLSTLIDTEINYCMIQALLTAKDFAWYDYQDLKAKLDNRLYRLESTNKRKLKKRSKITNFEDVVYYQSLWINPETFKIESIKITELGQENKRIFAYYKQYRRNNEQLIPYSIDIELYNDKEMRLEMVYYRISLDEKVEFPFSISQKYMLIQL
ncbi:MAG: DUF4292 domain-containing protein [Bacteroidales bacterium]|jgi:hypothetical protein|nr:DUF4292 domain-containing protein [Bacteroidales bacterium]